jgi:hypothetical protein
MIDKPPESVSSVPSVVPIGSSSTRRAHAVASFHRQIQRGSRARLALAAALDRGDASATLAAVERLLATLLVAEQIASVSAESNDDSSRVTAELRRSLVAAAPLIVRARALQPGLVDEVLRRFS